MFVVPDAPLSAWPLWVCRLKAALEAALVGAATAPDRPARGSRGRRQQHVPGGGRAGRGKAREEDPEERRGRSRTRRPVGYAQRDSSHEGSSDGEGREEQQQQQEEEMEEGWSGGAEAGVCPVWLDVLVALLPLAVLVEPLGGMLLTQAAMRAWDGACGGLLGWERQAGAVLVTTVERCWSCVGSLYSVACGERVWEGGRQCTCEGVASGWSMPKCWR